MEYELEPCRVCHEEFAYLENEGNCWAYVTCGHCGSHTAAIGYNTPEEKEEAERKSVELWNMGKVIAEKGGE